MNWIIRPFFQFAIPRLAIKLIIAARGEGFGQPRFGPFQPLQQRGPWLGLVIAVEFLRKRGSVAQIGR